MEHLINKLNNKYGTLRRFADYSKHYDEVKCAKYEKLLPLEGSKAKRKILELKIQKDIKLQIPYIQIIQFF